MQIRPFAEGDAVDAVLDAAYGDPRLRALVQGAHGPPRETPFRQTLVAEVAGEIAGAATVHVGTGDYAWVELVVAPEFRRRGLGTALVDELRNVSRGAPLAGRTHYALPDGIAFAKRHAPRLINESWDRRFDPAAVVARTPEAKPDAPEPDEAVEFLAAWFDDVHRWARIPPLTHDRARAMFCGDDVLPGSLVGVRDGGRLIGAANLTRPPRYDPGDEVYLVWIGAETEAAAATLVGVCARFALDRQKQVHFEIDAANATVRSTLAASGVLGEPALAFYAEE